MIIGLDLGNGYCKVYSEDFEDEFMVSWKQLSNEEYNSINPTKSIMKVKYNDNLLVVGDIGNTGITNDNKGDKSIRQDANMIKLVAIARFLKANGLKECDDIKVMTGTPYADYEKFKNDYLDLMISTQKEIIIVDDIEYNIFVTDSDVSKQGAVAIYNLPDNTKVDYLIWDFGGGTLDISLFEKGHRITGKTMPFSLNEIYVSLGDSINKYIDIDRGTKNNARYQKTIETLILEGKYKSTSVMKIGDTMIDMAEFVHNYLKTEVEQIIAKTVHEMNLNKTTLDSVINIFIGGGAKALEKELSSNVQLKNKRLQEKPQFSNPKAYYKMAKKKWM